MLMYTSSCLASPAVSLDLTRQIRPPQSASQRYRLVVLGSEVTGPSGARGLNNNTLVIGESGKTPGLWRGGTWTPVQVSGYKYVNLVGVNNRGEVLGMGVGPQGLRPFLWRNGAVQVLNILDGQFGHAWGLNDAGQIVGDIVDRSANRVTCLWSKAQTQPRRLPFIDTPVAINARGVILSSHITQIAGQKHLCAFLGTRRLPLLPGFPYCQPYGLNSRGEVVGYVLRDRRMNGKNQRIMHPYLWDGARAVDLDPSGLHSVATSINRRGDIAGCVGPYDHSQAVLWVHRRRIDLNAVTRMPPGFSLLVMNSINDKGEMAGIVVYRRQKRACLLVPLTKQ